MFQMEELNGYALASSHIYLCLSEVSSLSFYSFAKQYQSSQTDYTDMGSHQPQSSSPTTHTLSQPHPMLPNCTILLHSSTPLIQVQWPFLQQSLYDRWQQALTTYRSDLTITPSYSPPPSKYLLFPSSQQYRPVGFCSPTGVVTATYDLFDQPLVKEIQLRSHRNEPYSESSLWFLLQALVTAGCFLQDNSKVLGDVRSENIFAQIEEHSLKIATPVSWPSQSSLLSKYHSGESLFLSPQALQQLQSNVPLTHKMSCNNDAFAIGMTIAECLLLQDLSQIYIFSSNKRTFSLEKHKQLVSNLLKLKYYPPKLLLMTIGLIQPEAANRFTVEEVKDSLLEFTQQIQQRQIFSLTRQHFLQHFNRKFMVLDGQISEFKSRNHTDLFKKGELSLSYALTINGVSTVRPAKPTYDQTFNLQLFDQSSQHTARQNRVYQDHSPNDRSLNLQRYAKHMTALPFKGSNVLDQFYLQNTARERQIAPRKFKKELINLAPLDLVESQVQELKETPPRRAKLPSAVPVTNDYGYSPELKIFDQTEEMGNNFSFHSPESRLQHEQNENDKKENQQHTPTSGRPSLCESVLLPSVYQLAQPPESYVSYQYSISHCPPLSPTTPDRLSIPSDAPSGTKRLGMQFNEYRRQSYGLGELRRGSLHDYSRGVTSQWLKECPMETP